MIEYFSINACRKYGFPYIYSELAATEKAPVYESEPNGIAELEKVLEFVRNDVYYPSFSEKSAYIICSIAGSQYFTNGNKRLAVTILLMFLIQNSAKVLALASKFKELLIEKFPNYSWEENPNIDDPHSLFLYNLAVVLGDRTAWNCDDFQATRNTVAEIFSQIHKID